MNETAKTPQKKQAQTATASARHCPDKAKAAAAKEAAKAAAAADGAKSEKKEEVTNGGSSSRWAKRFTISNKPSPRGSGEQKEKDTQRDRLIAVALTAHITYWTDPDGNAFATVPSKGSDGKIDKIARYRLRSLAFKRLLRLLYGEAHPNMKATAKAGFVVLGGVSDTTMNEVLPTLEAAAQQGPVCVPAVRICRDRNGAVWIDLGDATWSLIEVSVRGWRIVKAAHVPLIRPNGLRALPVPARDPDALAKLRALLNLNPDEDASPTARAIADTSFRLVVAFMLSVLWPSGPYCILAVSGEHGSAKSTACRIVRMLTDPNLAPTRSVPRNPEDILITAQNSRLLVLDNVSRLSSDFADILCGIATGTGRGTRQLWTDAEEVIIRANNPIVINGIKGLLTRGDLADRALSVMLTAIEDEDRRDEAEMEAAIADAAPGVLALLLDATVTAMQKLPGLVLSRMPRMADFTRLACAAAPTFGWTVDEMFSAIEDNRQVTVTAVIAANAVATVLLEFLGQCVPDLAGYLWSGSATELQKRLGALAPPQTVKSPAWPKTAHHLSGRLKRVVPALRRSGVEITTEREGKGRNRKIAFKTNAAWGKDKAQEASAASAASAGNLFNDLEADASTPPASASASATDEAASRRTLNDALDNGASASASVDEDDYDADNIGQSHYRDAPDAADAEWHPILHPGEAWRDARVRDDDADDDEGEL
jgi:hypothetical protein